MRSIGHIATVTGCRYFIFENRGEFFFQLLVSHPKIRWVLRPVDKLFGRGISFSLELSDIDPEFRAELSAFLVMCDL